MADAVFVIPGVRAPARQPADRANGNHSLRGHSRRHVDLARVASALCCG